MMAPFLKAEHKKWQSNWNVFHNHCWVSGGCLREKVHASFSKHSLLYQHWAGFFGMVRIYHLHLILQRWCFVAAQVPEHPRLECQCKGWANPNWLHGLNVPEHCEQWAGHVCLLDPCVDSCWMGEQNCT